MINSIDVENRAKKIKIIVLDVDGVLTSGQIIFDGNGEAFKIFHARDGLGITLAHLAGIKSAIITGRTTDMVRLRSAELCIDDVVQGSCDKVASLDEILARHGLTYDQVAYMGDDLNDLAVMGKVGLACTVADAAPEAKAAAHFVSSLSGGRGAVREATEMIIKAQGKWQKIVHLFATPGPVELHQ